MGTNVNRELDSHWSVSSPLVILLLIWVNSVQRSVSYLTVLILAVLAVPQQDCPIRSGYENKGEAVNRVNGQYSVFVHSSTLCSIVHFLNNLYRRSTGLFLRPHAPALTVTFPISSHSIHVVCLCENEGRTQPTTVNE